MFQLRTGAAIPSVSDEDLKNILIPIPTEAEQKRIEKTIKESMDLREKSRQMLEKLSLEPYILA